MSNQEISKRDQLRALFPNITITDGYIGNVWPGGRDDRSWRVWTDIIIPHGKHSWSDSVNGLGQHHFQVFIDGPEYDVEKVASQIRAAAIKFGVLVP